MVQNTAIFLADEYLSFLVRAWQICQKALNKSSSCKTARFVDRFIRHLFTFFTETPQIGSLVVGVSETLITRLRGSDVRPAHFVC